LNQCDRRKKENKGKRDAFEQATETTDNIYSYYPIDEGLNDDAYRRLLYIAVVEDQYKEY
jgi:hypothetical protein